MSATRSNRSKARTFAEMADYWDSHDLAEVWDQTEPVEFEVDIREEVTLYPLSKSLAEGLSSKAEEKGMTPTEVLTLWVKEKLKE